jgi:hypothetical protein
MNLKGQWCKLQYWERAELRYYAKEKKWKSYWYFKKYYLLKNEKKNTVQIEKNCNAPVDQ